MQLVGKLTSLIGVEQRELRTATLMLAHSFAMGLTTVFFETAASALFLSHFESSALPWVYLTAAATSAVTGIVYTNLLGRIAFRRLMLGTLGFLAVTTVALRVGLWLTPAGGLLFAVLVWYRVISILTDLEYWAVAARMYDVRQAKRLYPFIGSGEVVARIAGAFSVPIFLGYMGVENLLLLSAAATAACMGVLGLALRGKNVDSAPESKSTETRWGLLEPLRAVTQTRYLRLLVSIAFFAVLGKYFVDFAFLAEMRGRFTEVKELASVFAIFSGVSQSLSLLTRFFVAGRVLNRYGVKAGLLVLPITHLACTILLVISGVAPGLAVLVFWFAIGNQGLYKTLKHPIDNPSFKILYQPLAKDERLKTQVAIETIVTPIGIAIAGAVMLQFSVLIPYDPVTFALALTMAFAGWVFFARRAGAAYAEALVEALRGRVEDIDYSFDDERNLPVLEEALASGRPPEVLFALALLEKTSHRPDQLERLLIRLLDHASPDVRIAALVRVEKHAMRSAIPSILDRLDVEQSPAVTGALLRALGTIGGGEHEKRVSLHLTHADPQIRMGALIGLLRNGRARNHLEALAASPNLTDRAFAARAIGEARLPELAPMLEPLLDDVGTGVRRATLFAAGRLGAGAPWARVIECLDDRALTGTATSALVSGGAAPLSHLTESFHPGVSPRRLQRSARVLGRRGDAEAAEILVYRIDFPNEIVRHEVLESLAACAFQAGPERRALIDDRLRREAKDAAAKLAAIHAVADTDLQLLRSALESELARSQDRLLLLLEYIYDREAMERVKENRTHASREKRAYALEVLDVTIDAEHKQMLMPLLDERKDRLSRIDEELRPASRSVEGHIKWLLERSPEWATPWTQACAVNALAHLGAVELANEVARTLSGGESDLVRSTLGSTLSRLRGATGEESGRKAMNTIERVLTLKGVEMFGSTPEEILADIAAILDELHYKPGEVIFEKGQVGDSMYIIIEGKVRVYDGERTIAHLSERDIFGELALLDPEPRFASISAETQTRLFRLDREAFLELMGANIEIVRGVLSVLCKRLRRSGKTLGPYQ